MRVCLYVDVREIKFKFKFKLKDFFLKGVCKYEFINIGRKLVLRKIVNKINYRDINVL